MRAFLYSADFMFSIHRDAEMFRREHGSISGLIFDGKLLLLIAFMSCARAHTSGANAGCMPIVSSLDCLGLRTKFVHGTLK